MQLLLLQIDELATFSDSPPPSVTRVLYTDKDVAARRYIALSSLLFTYLCSGVVATCLHADQWKLVCLKLISK